MKYKLGKDLCVGDVIHVWWKSDGAEIIQLNDNRESMENYPEHIPRVEAELDGPNSDEYEDIVSMTIEPNLRYDIISSQDQRGIFEIPQ